MQITYYIRILDRLNFSMILLHYIECHCYSYEGTGRSLSLKLLSQLRQQSATFGGNAASAKKTEQQISSSGIALPVYSSLN